MPCFDIWQASPLRRETMKHSRKGSFYAFDLPPVLLVFKVVKCPEIIHKDAILFPLLLFLPARRGTAGPAAKHNLCNPSPDHLFLDLQF